MEKTVLIKLFSTSKELIKDKKRNKKYTQLVNEKYIAIETPMIKWTTSFNSGFLL